MLVLFCAHFVQTNNNESSWIEKQFSSIGKQKICELVKKTKS
jgi:hypothetical protein